MLFLLFNAQIFDTIFVNVILYNIFILVKLKFFSSSVSYKKIWLAVSSRKFLPNLLWRYKTKASGVTSK